MLQAKQKELEFELQKKKKNGQVMLEDEQEKLEAVRKKSEQGANLDQKNQV